MQNTVQKEHRYHRTRILPRLLCLSPDAGTTRSDFAQEIAVSLGSRPRSTSPKFFYDERGSYIFERICELDEYYITRTETAILLDGARRLLPESEDPVRLVELGSGSSTKTRILLDCLVERQETTEYVPIDVSYTMLESSARGLLEYYPKLLITGIADTYSGGLRFVGESTGSRNVIAFLGSSIGNFTPHDAAGFLSSVKGAMRKCDSFLLGFDTGTNKDALYRAYNDSKGVTAEFNRNILHRINSELGADFDPDLFSHEAVFNDSESRIEMYLRSKEMQTVHIPGAGITVKFDEGERIHTENSYKFSTRCMSSLLRGCGMRVHDILEDDDGRYAVMTAGVP